MAAARAGNYREVLPYLGIGVLPQLIHLFWEILSCSVWKATCLMILSLSQPPF
jgi:hypothetical protein